LYSLGECNGVAVYGFLSSSRLILVNAPAGVWRFVEARLRQLGVKAAPAAVLLTSADPPQIEGLAGFGRRAPGPGLASPHRAGRRSRAGRGVVSASLPGRPPLPPGGGPSPGVGVPAAGDPAGRAWRGPNRFPASWGAEVRPVHRPGSAPSFSAGLGGRAPRPP